MDEINLLKAYGFEALNDLKELIFEKEQKLLTEFTRYEVKQMMFNNYRRLERSRKQVMIGIEKMNPEIKN